MTEELKNKIANLQPSSDNRWFHEGQDDFYELTEFLLEKGLSEDDVCIVLSKAYRTVANEYGD